jgi:hypothetical protein
MTFWGYQRAAIVAELGEVSHGGAAGGQAAKAASQVVDGGPSLHLWRDVNGHYELAKAVGVTRATSAIACARWKPRGWIATGRTPGG